MQATLRSPADIDRMLDNMANARRSYEQSIGMIDANATIGRWRMHDADKGDYLSVSIFGNVVRTTEYNGGIRGVSQDMTPAQWKRELAGMLLLGFIRS